MSYRTYGEWIENGKKKSDGTYEDGKAKVKALEGHFDPKFRGFDMDYPDVKRAERFIEELQRFEKEGEMPQLHHTAAAERSHHRHASRQADADCDASPTTTWRSAWSSRRSRRASSGRRRRSSSSRTMPRTARTTSMRIASWRWSSRRTRSGRVDSTMYSTTSMLRTMELILGLKPMSQFDAAATPMYRSFTAKADVTPYIHEVPKTDLKAVNVAGTAGSELVGTG